MSNEVTAHRWSISTAWLNASSVARRNRDGEVVAFTPLRRMLAMFRTPYIVISPAVTVYRHPGRVTARIVDLACTRIIFALVLVSAAVSAAIAWRSSDPAIYVPMAAIAVALSSGALGSFEDLRAARAVPSESTHLISDLVKAPVGSSGVGADVVTAIRHQQPGRIIGTTPAPKVWNKVYQHQADALETTHDGRTRFVLHQDF